MKLMDIFNELAPNKLFISILLGTLSGGCYAFLIPILLNSFTIEDSVLRVMNEQPYSLAGFEVSDVKFALLFAGLCLCIFLTRTMSQIIMVRLTMDLTSKLRLKLYQRVLRASLDNLESVGFSKINATMTYDVERVIEGAEVFPNLLVSGVTLCSMLGLLYYLNEHLFILVFGSITFGAVTYLLMAVVGNYYFSIARQKVDDLYGAIHGTIFGIKELKLKKSKRDNYFDKVLSKIEHDVCKASKTGATVQSAAVNYGNILGYFFLGGVAFVFVNHYSVSQLELIGIIMVLIYKLFLKLPSRVNKTDVRTIHEGVFIFLVMVSSNLLFVCDVRSCFASPRACAKNVPNGGSGHREEIAIQGTHHRTACQKKSENKNLRSRMIKRGLANNSTGLHFLHTSKICV